MAKEKHYVFSARTTGEGLRLLGELRQERKVGWDDLVIDAMCAHYGLDRAVMAPPKKAQSANEAGQPTESVEEKPSEEKPIRKRGKGGKAK